MKLIPRHFLISIIVLIIIFAGIKGLFSFIGTETGKGPVTTEVHNTSSFTKIDISGAFEIQYVKSDNFEVTVITNGNLQKLISVKVEDNLLKVKNIKTISHSDKLELIINCPILEFIELSGANHLICSDSLISEKLIVDMSGASELQLKGKSTNLDINLSGAGNIDAKQFPSDDVKINLSGAAEAIVYPINRLNAEISGAGSIKYLGDPKSIKQNISGAGSIEKIN